MQLTKDIAHHGAVAAGLAGLFTAAVLGAQLAATAVISIGELLIR
ncbi:hypothetical protein J2Y58_002112 [Sphingomonas sp. BE138]|nr:hypothetical protein [Sphingomonas sp. BE138]MDR6788747.1 hypothetical protein [Sphingomonas sp. BE138]